MSEPVHRGNPSLQRLTLGGGLALALIVVGGSVLGWRVLDGVDVKHQQLAYGAAQELADVDAMAVALQERSANARGYLLSGDATFLEARQVASDAFDARLAALHTRYAGTPTERDLEHMTMLWQRLDTASDRAMAAMDQGRDAAIEVWEHDARPLQGALTAEVAAMVAAQRARFQAARLDAQEATSRGRAALAGLASVVAVTLAALFWALARSARQVVALVGREQEQTMFRVLDEVPVGVFVVDAAGKPYYSNRWAHRLLGRAAHEADGVEPLVMAQNAVEAGTGASYPAERTPLARALRGESSEVSDMEIRRGQDTLPIHVRGGPIYGADGKLAFAVAAFQDVRALHDAALRDPLTGLGNRRALAQSFVRERMLQERAGGNLALAVLDLDHFKQINDTHGHAAGDAVLKRTASTLLQTLRRTDLVIRWGGEELVVVLPNVDLTGAQATIDKALSAVRSESFVGPTHTTFHVTFSAGLVMIRPNESLESAVARADALLYVAKGEGRNRVLAETAS